ncbi:methyltransferase domain-containing protein [Paenibacillus athensensis]|uniref:Methyltransferase type 11 n=1 Tax=Paenibacillus athensensis TaxID=1967502 RepID=A0A4Y8Q4F6_9BACL|nr:pseudaminic acid biosynthesis-associated methylase [Paenibacillus athensensis]MCD1260840.1 methyltransferase domain-containing protein [Paenibacillus athensensis]
MNTQQIDFWKGKFGADYTDRNTFSVEELDRIYADQYGITRTDMNTAFIKEFTTSRVLEVGCNVGNILLNLQSIGFDKLYGVELQHYAVKRAKTRTTGINIIQGSAFDLPFKDGYFDMVYTSGVLIHIAPKDIGKVMDEMYRVSSRYIWGFEYYADQYTEIDYHGNGDKLWKANFAGMLLERFSDLRLVKEMKHRYLKNVNNVDQMYLLEKK